MIAVEIHHNLARLAPLLRQYAIDHKKTEEQTIAKQSYNLADFVYKGMKKIMPEKGSIKGAELAALQGGKGVHVRETVLARVAAKYNATTSIASGETFLKTGRAKKSAYAREVVIDGKRMNLQALAVDRELNLRESARGFSAYAVPRPSYSFKNSPTVGYESERDSRYGFKLSDFSFEKRSDTLQSELRWLGKRSDSYNDAVDGLSKPKQQKVLAEAIRETQRGIVKQLKGDIETNIRKFGLS